MKVESVHIYPVKSTAPTMVTTADVELAGLRHDRRWMLVDETSKRVSASKCNALLAVTATVAGDGNLLLSAEGHPDLPVDVPVHGRHVPVTLSRMSTAVDAGDDAAGWFSVVADRPLRLVWQDDPTQRTVGESHGGVAGEPLNLADTAPLLLTTRSSLAQLNEWIAADHEPETVLMRQFRPNVVIDGEAPFAEDDWQQIRIGDVSYRFAEHCDRCVVTTIDPLTLHHSKEPIRSMARHRKWDGKTWFGIRIIPLETGTLSVGDDVTVA